MTIAYWLAWVLPVGAVVLEAGGVSAQTYPHKPIRIVTGGVGGGNDFSARLIAQEISSTLGQRVIVENRGGGNVPGEIVANAAPDGYTLLVSANNLYIGPLLQKTPYDPVRDFTPITLMVKSPAVLVVSSTLPVNTVKELIALARAKPGELNYPSGGTGGSGHLTGELFKSMAGINIVRIPYKGSAASINALMAGEVQLAFEGTTTVMPLVKAGKLKALAVTTAEPTALVPGISTMTASGVPGYEFATSTGLYATAKTPAAIIKRINQEVVRFLNRADVKDKYFGTGVEVVGSSPEQYAANIKSEMARMGKVIKEAGIRIE